MCSIVLAAGLWEGAPLVVAANRDEALSRPAAPPSLHRPGALASRWVLAPTDLEAGGTWLGLNDAGLFVGITNRFGRPPRAGLRSRGHLVTDGLGFTSAERAVERMAEIRADAYNGFHLIVADRSHRFVIWGDGETTRVEVLKAGFHVVTERSFDAAPSERPARIGALLAGLETGPKPPETTSWRALLSDHIEAGSSGSSLEGVCIHADDMGYGTRSSTIIELGVDTVRFLHAEGPPCTHPHVDMSAMAERLATP